MRTIGFRRQLVASSLAVVCAVALASSTTRAQEATATEVRPEQLPTPADAAPPATETGTEPAAEPQRAPLPAPPSPLLAPAPVAAAPAEPGQASRGWPVSAWAVGGAGAALFVGGAIAGVVALGKNSKLEKLCPNAACSPANQARGADLEEARDRAVVFADLGVVGGLACLVTATYLILEHQRPGPARSATGLLRVTPNLGLRDGGLLASVRF